ncbi:MAG TPA: ABC transporter ATP-binding protein [Nitriliruptorales bacterium]|nr:ABC transporter ATP-binding protein [Nitriliruptorales bacterium]
MSGGPSVERVPRRDRPLLAVRDLDVYYGAAHVLQGVDLDVGCGQVLALFGRNGAGKTTLVHAVMGMVHPAGGSVRFDGHELAGRPAHVIARHGVALVPQGRRIFPTLTVGENLALATRAVGPGGWTLDRVYSLFPLLRARHRHRGTQLSGGEQQMLALGRALLQNPRLLLLDEPSEGLAPRVVEQITEALAELRSSGLPALLVEQNLGMALQLADTAAIMTKGRIAWRGSAEEFRHAPERARTLLGLS